VRELHSTSIEVVFGSNSI